MDCFTLHDLVNKRHSLVCQIDDAIATATSENEDTADLVTIRHGATRYTIRHTAKRLLEFRATLITSAGYSKETSAATLAGRLKREWGKAGLRGSRIERIAPDVADETQETETGNSAGPQSIGADEMKSKPVVNEYVDAGTAEAPAMDTGNVASMDKARASRPAPEIFTATGNADRDSLAVMFMALGAIGFKHEISVFDGSAVHECSIVSDAIWRILQSNEATLMIGNGRGSRHGVFLVPGNGTDIVGNWSSDHDDANGFNQTMLDVEALLNPAEDENNETAPAPLALAGPAA